MRNRDTLTKSLHTVTVVSRVANHLMNAAPDRRPLGQVDAIRDALSIVGQESAWSVTDPTFAACLVALRKLRGS